jgi:uncharacterized protein
MPNAARTRIARFVSGGCALFTGAVLFCSAAVADGPSPPDPGFTGGGIAVKRLLARAQRGDARSQAMLGFMYANGTGVPQSYEVAARWYVRSAEQGDPDGQYLLGLMYDKGFGVTADVVLAYKWLSLAAAHAPRQSRENFLRMREAVAGKMTQNQIELAQRLAVDFDSTQH